MKVNNATLLFFLLVMLLVQPEGGEGAKKQSEGRASQGRAASGVADKCVLQVAIVLETVHQHIEVISQWIEAVANHILKAHKNTEFALTTFGDYPGMENNHSTSRRPTAWYVPPGKRSSSADASPRETDPKRWGSDPEGCYQRQKEFGTPIDNITGTFESYTITQFNRIDSSSALTAMAFTAADRRIGWRPNTYKVILFATTNMDSVHNDDWVRVPPNGDGNDTCTKNKPPDLGTFKDILDKNDIKQVLGLVGEFNDSEKIGEHFNSYFYTAFQGNNERYEVYKCPEQGYSVHWGDIELFKTCTEHENATKFVMTELRKDFQCLKEATTTTPLPTTEEPTTEETTTEEPTTEAQTTEATTTEEPTTEAIIEEPTTEETTPEEPTTEAIITEEPTTEEPITTTRKSTTTRKPTRTTTESRQTTSTTKKPTTATPPPTTTEEPSETPGPTEEFGTTTDTLTSTRWTTRTTRPTSTTKRTTPFTTTRRTTRKTTTTTRKPTTTRRHTTTTQKPTTTTTTPPPPYECPPQPPQGPPIYCQVVEFCNCSNSNLFDNITIPLDIVTRGKRKHVIPLPDIGVTWVDDLPEEVYRRQDEAEEL